MPVRAWGVTAELRIKRVWTFPSGCPENFIIIVGDRLRIRCMCRNLHQFVILRRLGAARVLQASNAKEAM